MKTKSKLKIAALALGLFALPVLADDSSTIRLALQNTGVDTNAAGTVVAQLKSKSSTLTLTLANLTPGTAYTVNNGDTPEANFVADPKGRARVLFTTSSKKNTFPLDFDPRGGLLSVRENGTNILQAVVSGSGEPDKSAVTERVELKLSGTKSKAVAQFIAFSTGRRTFSVQLSGVTGTNWSLYVDGLLRGSLNSRGSSGRISFDTQTNRAGMLLLDFDPRGKVLDIAQETNLVFTGAMAAQALNVNVATPRAQLAFIPSTGIDADGTARAKLKVDKQARRKFSVELEDVPLGTYELLADGVFKANIQVVTTDSVTEGEVEFSTDDDDSDELPLTFEPTNSVFTVQRDGSVYFTGGLTNGSSGTGTNSGPAFLDEQLTSTGLDADAHGDARYEVDDRGREKFQVEIEDVVVGDYALWVGGIERGTISVTLINGKVNGEIEFEAGDDDSSELPLTFDPRGQLIEVKSGAGTFFSHTFGSGNGTNSVSVPGVTVQLPLFSATTNGSATAEMKFKRDDDGGESFEVEIEDAATGNYELWVGATQRATIAVVNTASGTHGQVEFDDSPKAGQLPLNFNPQGELITIVREGVTYFQRLLPAGL